MPALDLPALDTLPALPRDADGPVFREPWEAQAFAMTVELHRAGRFTWREWTEALTAEIAAARAGGAHNSRGEPDSGDAYYHRWLAALEALVGAKGLVGADELAERKAALARP
jgi:nitrile hydratase accessory protein